jgi:hypothetical protein
MIVELDMAKHDKAESRSLETRDRCGSIRVIGNPETDAIAARQVVVNVVTGTIIGDTVFGETVGEGADLRVTTQRFVDDCVERMAPGDPVEELLISQLLLTHGRVVRLSHLAQQKLSYDEIRNLNELADRASNTYRKLMLALAEYRRPARGSSITAIQQANIANEQVVMNGSTNESKNATNEQGCEHATSASPLPVES